VGSAFIAILRGLFLWERGGMHVCAHIAVCLCPPAPERAPHLFAGGGRCLYAMLAPPPSCGRTPPYTTSHVGNPQQHVPPSASALLNAHPNYSARNRHEPSPAHRGTTNCVGVPGTALQRDACTHHGPKACRQPGATTPVCHRRIVTRHTPTALNAGVSGTE
jgi:hypothetical protein